MRPECALIRRRRGREGADEGGRPVEFPRPGDVGYKRNMRFRTGLPGSDATAGSSNWHTIDETPRAGHRHSQIPRTDNAIFGSTCAALHHARNDIDTEREHSNVKTNARTPWIMVSCRMGRDATATSDTCEVIPTTNAKYAKIRIVGLASAAGKVQRGYGE